VVVRHGALDLRSSLHLQPDSAGSDREDVAVHRAAAVWRRSDRTRRLRWAGVGVATLTALAVVLLLPPAPAPEPPLPTEIPEGVVVLPAINDLMQDPWLGSDLPSYLVLGPSDVDRMPPLAEAPLEYAVLAVPASGERLVLAGYDSTVLEPVLAPTPQRRRIEHPALRGARLLATSLSPDGTTLALPKAGGLVLVDVRTGRVRTIEVGAVQPSVEAPVLTWLDPTRVMVPGLSALVVDVATDEVAPLNADASNLISVRGHGSPWLVELVAAPPGTTQGAQTVRSLLFWRNPAAADDTSRGLVVTGSPWLSAWTGSGFAGLRLVVRACDPGMVRLPRDVGTASGVVAALDGNGNEIATLVATDGTRLDTLGILGQEPEHALVALRSEGRSLVVAWNPYNGTVAAVTHLNADAQVSIADLLKYCPYCRSRMETELAQTNAETPVNASPTTS
jgi:hypothetical protein